MRRWRDLQVIAAITLNNHGHEEVPRDPDGTPYCSDGLRMTPISQFEHTNGFHAQRFRCPLLFPERTGEVCDHAQFAKGRGCVQDPNWEKGGLMRTLLDRTSPLYQAVYTQRTSCERINNQAQALGIERPKVRNGRSVANLNTLIYLIINVRALQLHVLKLEHSFATVIVLHTQSTRYHGPQPLKRFQRIVLLI